MDPELADDVIGVASARLLAAGLPGPRRRAALRLLGALGSVAAADLRVRRPLADIAGEFGIDPGTASTALDDLSSVAVVRREPEGIRLGGAEPADASGLRIQDFLALADDLDERRHRRTRVLRPAAAALAAAALVAALLLAPGALHQGVTPVSSGGGPDRARPTTTSVDPATEPAPAADAPTDVLHAPRTATGNRSASTPSTAGGTAGACPSGKPGPTFLDGAPPLEPTPSTVVAVPPGTDVNGLIGDRIGSGTDGPPACPSR